MTVRVVVATDRLRDPEPHENALHAVASRTLARTLERSGRPVCLAAPAALPVRSGSLAEAVLDRSTTAHDLAAAVREASRALAPGGTLAFAVTLRIGHAGLWRRAASAILPIAAPRDPDAVARDLVLAGFDRVEIDLQGSTGRYRARRLRGRAGNSP